MKSLFKKARSIARIAKWWVRSKADLEASSYAEIKYRLERFLSKNGDSSVFRFPWGDFHYASPRLLIGQFEEIFINEFYGCRTSSSEPVIVDCGGNMGLSAVYFKRTYPGSKLTILEPDPKLAKLIQTNLDNGAFKGAAVVEAAAWVEDGQVEFDFKGDDSGAIVNRGGTLVKAVDLATFLPDRVDLLKLDIEGAEFAVLKRLCDSGAIQRIENLVIEFHVTRERIDDMLESLGGLRSAGMELAFTAQLEAWIGSAKQEAPFSCVGRHQNLMLVYAWRKKPIAAKRCGDGTETIRCEAAALVQNA